MLNWNTEQESAVSASKIPAESEKQEDDETEEDEEDDKDGKYNQFKDCPTDLYK